jgi:hypothetical protein
VLTWVAMRHERKIGSAAGLVEDGHDDKDADDRGHCGIM